MRLFIVAFGFVCSIGLSGCAYFSNRDFGDCYDTTKWFLHHRYTSPGRRLGNSYSLGQFIGGSGHYLLGIGAVVTEPAGWAVNVVESLALAPIYDTLMLPADLCCRSEAEIRADEEARVDEEWRRLEEISRRQLEEDAAGGVVQEDFGIPQTKD